MNLDQQIKQKKADELRLNNRRLGVSACREGNVAGFPLIYNEQPEHLRVSAEEFQSWKEAWEVVAQRAEVEKGVIGTVVRVSDFRYTGYGVVSGPRSALGLVEVTLGCDYGNQIVSVRPTSVDTQETASVRINWSPDEKILELSKLITRGWEQRMHKEI